MITRFACIVAVLALAGCSTAQPKKEAATIPVTPSATPKANVSSQEKVAVPATHINGIAAIVNDDVITFKEVLREAQPVINDAQRKGVVTDKARHELRLTVRDRLIEKMLTEQKVKELGIKIGEEEIRQAIDDVKRQNGNMTQIQLEAALKSQGFTIVQYETQIREQLERLRLIGMEVRSKVYVSDREAQQYYDSHRQNYAEDELFRARHIFVKIDEKAPAAQIQAAMDKALKILYEARQGKDFAKLAVQYSEDPAAKKDGGDLGTFKRGDMMADLEKALISLKPGEVGELVSTPSGLHIVKLEERVSNRYKPFNTVAAEIRELLHKQKQDERFNTWMKELKQNASIIVKDSTGIL
ncbi:MAG: peptidylprolyl isomerase [Trichlorobacter sp.]|jgi:peptidyl-prolyl cis-trans isomerase SurA